MSAAIKLLCVVQGTSVVFSVHVNPTAYVHTLKKAIFEKRKNGALKGYDATCFHVRKVDMDLKEVGDSLALHTFPLGDPHDGTLFPPCRIGRFWKSQPPIDHVHVVVVP